MISDFFLFLSGFFLGAVLTFSYYYSKSLKKPVENSEPHDKVLRQVYKTGEFQL